MLWLIKNILFSISLIVIIHYLYIYFETTLTAPKVKDLIHCPKQKYKSLFDTINKNLENTIESNPHLGGKTGSRPTKNLDTNTNIDTDNIDGGRGAYNEGPQKSNKDLNDMKTDLKSFLRGIGLKSKSNNEYAFRSSYEMN
jgi:hypothetical protein